MRSHPVSPAHGPRRLPEEPGVEPGAGRRFPPPGSGAYYGSQARAEDQQVADDAVPWSVYRRLLELSSRHAEKAWRLRYSMPLAPFALAFLYVQPHPKTPQSRVVSAATKLWHAGPEAETLVPLLVKFTTVIVQHAKAMTSTDGAGPGPVWDLRDQLAERCDPQMSPDAAYLGVGLSSLNTTAGSFTDICQQVSSELWVPGVFCYLSHPCGREDADYADYQAFLAQRHAAVQHLPTTLHSCQAFTAPVILAPHPYAKVTPDDLYRSAYGQVLRAMWDLDQAARAADTARRELAQAPRPRGGRRKP